MEIISGESIKELVSKISYLIYFFEGIEEFLAKKLEMKTLFQLSFNKTQNEAELSSVEMEPFLN